MSDAPATAILWPAVAMVGLTFLVWVRLYQLRLGEMARKRIDAQSLANAADSVRLLVDTRASDNFRNLFELPVLFYAGVLLAAQLGVSDGVSLALAWAFIALRAVHSLVHCTFNHVMTRFVAYALATLVLIAFWVRLALAMVAA
ncbi:MAPEG family protein [Pseudoxanthomonas sp. LH2527]|uniref:MAPEG family protein n=1 Tax=Pseudoxanthomonas sp. LH2527 TaxID=2923249 RepID=UPI001F147A22|nr:MAPEG family protein [Pseudoxanthomonas sp. LH2527]MCH6483467.1 MAPEG family protein [Pseudoxanthomonas sp. LH2527]